MAHFNGLLGRKDLPPMKLSADTTFDIVDDAYVTVVTYRATDFEEQPTIPLIYMIHDRKWQEVHELLFKRLTDFAPGLKDPKAGERTVIASDDEAAIVNAIKMHLPHIPSVRCWIHAGKNIKMKLRTLGVTKKKDLAAYKRDFMELLEQKSENDYKDLLLTKTLKWPQVSRIYGSISIH